MFELACLFNFGARFLSVWFFVCGFFLCEMKKKKKNLKITERTFAGQYCMNGFLQLEWAPWKRTLLTRSIALGPALSVALLANTSLDTLNEWLNVQQSVQLPFALLPLLFFNSNKRVMGEFTLTHKMQFFYWLVSGMVLAVMFALCFVLWLCLLLFCFVFFEAFCV